MQRLPGSRGSIDPQITTVQTRPDSDYPEQELGRRLIGPLFTFVGQRLAFGALVLGAITFLSYLGLDMARGASLRPALNTAVASTLAYLGRLVRGDLGLAQAGTLAPRAVPVTDELGAIVGKSMGLLGLSLLIAVLIGVTLGVWAASRRRSAWSVVTLTLSVVGISAPSFFAALLLQLLMVRWARLFGSPLLPIGGFGWDKHLVLPALVLAARPVAQIARMTFIAVAEVLSQDYVRTAQGKGLWPRQVWLVHVLRNAAIPVLTTVGLSLRFSLSSLPVVEFFFGWPGLGFTLLRAISRQDDNLTVALVLSLGLVFILVNLLLDLSYRLLDPRLRETVGQVTRGQRSAAWDWLKGSLAAARAVLVRNPLQAWRQHRQGEGSPSPFAEMAARLGQGEQEDLYRVARQRAWWRGVLSNSSLLVGGLLVCGLLLLVLIGPRLAPHNPYATQGLTIVDGQFMVPPFEPGALYPWGTDVLGRDIMSLVLAGAQQTLVLAVVVVAVRLAVGFLTGALAGWFSESWFDRLVLSLSEVLAAFPTLLLAMILILALGIRQGMQAFVVALGVVGWGEIMQFVRSEVMTIRPQLYIESAVAAGLRTSRILLSHVLPLLGASLIAIVALEMGAVLMLLGELGFVGIFIGGGALAELTIGAPLYHYSDVPEWASLLSNVRAYGQAYPWVAFFPALAFFVSILGFNLFGEGLRRLVETVGVGINRLLNRYTVAMALVALLAAGWVRANTGSMAFYRQYARMFDGQKALAQLEALSEPAIEGRSLGSVGLDRAADAIAQQFKDLGLQPGGEGLTYFQTRYRSFQVLDAVPQLVVADGGSSLSYRSDFSEFTGRYRNLGQVAGPLRVLLARELSAGSWQKAYPALQEAVDTDDIILALTGEMAGYYQGIIPDVSLGGLLVVAPDSRTLMQHATLSPRDPTSARFGTNRVTGQDVPSLWISQEVADRLLAQSGYTVADLRALSEGLENDEIRSLQAGINVSLALTGTVQERLPVRNVIGHLPGVAGRASAGEGQLDNQLIVVLAQYDSPPAAPDGPLQAANDNGSGVAVMLEAVRVLQESGYQPYRTLLFVAYAGEGLDGGEVVRPEEVRNFLQAKAGFATAFDVEAAIHLRGVGAGTGEDLVVASGGVQRLTQLFERSANLVGANTSRSKEFLDLSMVFENRSAQQGGGQEAPLLSLSWAGWQETSHMPADRMQAIDAKKLEQAGQTLALALMIMGRENRY